MSKSSPSLIRTLFNDLGAWSYFSMGIGVLFLLLYKGREAFEDTLTHLLFIGLCVFGLWMSFTAFEKVFRLFRSGRETQGKIFLKEKRWWGMSRFTYMEVEYKVGNKRYTISIKTWIGRFARDYSRGKEVTVLYDPKRPKSAVVKELFD